MMLIGGLAGPNSLSHRETTTPERIKKPAPMTLKMADGYMAHPDQVEL